MLLYISVIGLATYRLLPSLFQISICISNLKFSRSHLFEVAKISRELKSKENTINVAKTTPEHDFADIFSVKIKILISVLKNLKIFRYLKILTLSYPKGIIICIWTKWKR